MKDVVISNGNEEEFIEMAERLGYDELTFVTNKTLNLKSSKVKVSFEKNIFKSDLNKDRNLIESKKASMIYELEQDLKKDKTHYRNSGLNHVLAELMNKKKVSYGLSFNQVLVASKEQRARLFGRMMQNLMLCRKYKVNVVLASFARHPSEMRDFNDLVSFARVLGLNG
ncbi:hypothetical protein JXB27_00795 [Candidatus Woesearchaeota archaeon]|nr:hypothetical protein [Candidatus Woesearchaeota archaeon]